MSLLPRGPIMPTPNFARVIVSRRQVTRSGIFLSSSEATRRAKKNSNMMDDDPDQNLTDQNLADRASSPFSPSL